MSVTLGVVANVYNEINALPGWLEMAHAMFDHVAIYHAGPGGAWSNDGTMELLEKWRVPVQRGSIDDGFGIVRTAAIRSSPCDWVMILDADERFYRYLPELTCVGESTPPDEVGRILQEYDNRDTEGRIPSNWENVGRLGAKLSVNFDGVYDQGAWLRDVIQHRSLDGVATIRRHWHDFSWRRPTQNWHEIPDYQLRVVRNHPSIHFDPNVRMHEALLGADNVYRPNHRHGPFFDHYHLHFKRMEAEQRAHDCRIYDALHEGREVPKE